MGTPARQRLIAHSCPDIGDEELRAVTECLRSLHVKGGSRRDALEEVTARDQGYREGVATTTGGHAIHLGLRILFPRGGARIGVPSYVCRSVYDACILARCVPVLTDVDPDTFAVSLTDVDQLELDAVIVAHMFGIRAPIERYLKLGLPIIEDCAQRVLPCDQVSGEPKGTVRIISLEATKLLTAGEGGLLLLDAPELARRARQLRDGGYSAQDTALWLPLTDLQASVAIVQWSRLAGFLRLRKELAAFYREKLSARFASLLPGPMFDRDNIFFRFVLSVSRPERFIEEGAALGISFRRPVAPQPLHALFAPIEGSFPVTEELMRRLISIPIYPRLSQAEAEKVAEVTIALLEGEPGQ